MCVFPNIGWVYLYIVHVLDKDYSKMHKSASNRESPRSDLASSLLFYDESLFKKFLKKLESCLIYQFLFHGLFLLVGAGGGGWGAPRRCISKKTRK